MGCSDYIRCVTLLPSKLLLLLPPNYISQLPPRLLPHSPQWAATPSRPNGAPMSTSVSPLMNKREAATYLSVSVTTLDRWVKRGLVPAIKLGRGVRFNLADLQAVVLGGRLSTKRQ